MTKQIRKFFFPVFAILSVSIFIGCSFFEILRTPLIPLDPPSNVRVKRSRTNAVTITWRNSANDNDTNYWVYYNSVDDTSNAECIGNSHNGNTGCSLELESSGTYYFWVKAVGSDFSSVASYDFTYYPNYITPSNVTIAPTDRTNQVTISWLRDEFVSSTWDWLYMNTENDFSTATCLKKVKASLCNDHNSFTSILPETGTYYFWVLTSNEETDSATTKKSELSSVASYNFTYTQLTPPINIRAETYSGVTTIKWDDNNSVSYWLYCNYINDSSTAVLCGKYEPYYTDSGVNSSDAYTKIGYHTPYYFWIKSADGDASTSSTSDFSDVVRTR